LQTYFSGVYAEQHVISDPTLRRPTNARGDVIVALVAILAALASVYAFRLQFLVETSGDPYSYGQIARGLVEHGFTTLTRRAASLYPEAIAVIYRLGGNNFSVVLLQCLLHVGTCLVVYALGQRLFNARTGLLAGLLCALHPMLLRYVPDLHMESMLTFLCTVTVWFAVNFYERPTVRNGTVLGAVGMCATLMKGVMLPVVVAFGVAIVLVWLWRGASKSVMMAGLAMAGAMAVLLAPWTYRNYQVTGGRFVLLTPGASDSFLRGYVFTRWEFATLRQPPYTDAENECNDWFVKIANDAGVTWSEDEVTDEVNNARVVKHLIITQPIETVRKITMGMFTFWYEMTTRTNSMLVGLLALAGWVLAAVGQYRADREGQQAWLIWLPIVVMNVFVALLIPLGRYSVPVIPSLMILAAFGIDTLLMRWNARAL
jgi:4-amino-4-deoxy-L-arabinose transferase-like glycosyltransferase